MLNGPSSGAVCGADMQMSRPLETERGAAPHPALHSAGPVDDDGGWGRGRMKTGADGDGGGWGQGRMLCDAIFM